MSEEAKEIERTGLETAIIGMAARFPGAAHIDEFWENLKNGVESIAFFTDEELEEVGFGPGLLSNANLIKARGILSDIEYFDAAFFAYTPMEAELMDPQIRILYECTWWALEHAGYSADSYKGSMGIYVGATNNRLWEGSALFSGNGEVLGNFALDHLIDRDYLSTRLAYRLNLTGPAITMKTACSTSLVAVDLACRSLLTGQCDIALAGGISVPGIIKSGYLYQEGMIKSPDGHCRAFDARAEGVVFSDGVGVVVLKRLEDALQDGDHILAIIRGSAVNNDGSRKGAYSAPGLEGQANVIRAALHFAALDPETIDYVETHGTGTTLGDPIEIEALKIAFDTDKKHFCAIGSVKSNIGHLDTAAGIAGLIKTVLAIHHKLIPPSLHFENPNPKIDFENSPFYVTTQAREWKRADHPRRAGVSSFGVGGTNVHVVLEECPGSLSSNAWRRAQGAERNEHDAWSQGRGGVSPPGQSREHQLILLSAKTKTALDQMTENLFHHLQLNPQLNLADAAYTLQLGRTPFKHRQMLSASAIDQVIQYLIPADDGTPFETANLRRAVARDETRPVFLFPGQGSQYANMGWDLYREEPMFREEIDRCFEILNTLVDIDIKKILYPPERSDRSDQSDHSDLIDQTEIAQPVLFIFEYALAKLLMSWGIIPYAMIGHSIGEYTAACLAGVLSREDAVQLVALRGKLMQQMPTGSMLSVPLAEKELIPLLPPDVELAGVNAPKLCVVSGPHQAIEGFKQQLEEKGHICTLLHTSHAFHSRSMNPILKEFENEVGKVALNPPEIPYISNLTGTWITVEETADPGYWARHLSRTVRFADGLTEILKDENVMLVEVGPGRTLSIFARQHQAKKPGHLFFHLVRHPKKEISDSSYLLNKIGQIWLHGQPVNWQQFYARERRYRLPLPLYPFQREYFWISADVLSGGSGLFEGSASLNQKKDFHDWFYIPSWKRTLVPTPESPEKTGPINWLFFMDQCGIGSQLTEQLKADNHEIIMVTPGEAFKFMENGEYAINPGKEQDYVTLLESLEEKGKRPQRMIHLWNITGSDHHEEKTGQDERYLEQGFYSLLYLAQAIGKQDIKDEIRLMVFSNQMQVVNGDEELCPGKALVLGPVNVIPAEFPNIQCRTIDLVLPEPGGTAEKKLIHQLLDEIASDAPDTAAAYRNNYRLAQTYEPAPIPALPEGGETIPCLKEGGVYLVTGGLGGMGLVLAEYLAGQVGARLILTGRSAFPAREEWDQWLSSHTPEDAVSQKIRKVQHLETLGAEVLVFSVDVTDYRGMKEVLDRARDRFGPLNGVVHAAGVPGGGMIRLKTREMADAVLLPKVRGTRVLDSLLHDKSLDFFLLCSSISSILPAVGQVDYFSANAFLDAFAFYKTAKDNMFTISINWDAWQEVGMAVEAAKASPGPPAAANPQPLENPHPLFEYYIPLAKGRRKYVTHLELEKNWPLNEHMTSDLKGLLPGTTYLEMARAAWESFAGQGPVEIYDAHFLNPMMVAKDEEREVHLVLEEQPGEDHFQFLVESSIPTEKDFLQKHAMGKIKPIPEEKPRSHDLEELKARCDLHEVIANQRENGEVQGGLLIFGPRWKTTRWTRFGKTEGLTMIELPADYAGELEQYKLHPALLDKSTGSMFGYISGGRAYIPFSYKRLRMLRPLPAKIISYCRLAGDTNPGKEFLKFDVTIMDEQGRECVDIEEFTMLEVSEDIKTRIREKEHVSSSGAAPAPPPAVGDAVPEELTERQKLLLKTGIRSVEGVEAFKRILKSRQPQVVVSTTDLPLRIRMQKAAAADGFKEPQQERKPTGPKHARPELSTPYVEPRTKMEKIIAQIWQEQLGIDRIGSSDDFFELGGDSLKAITVSGKIHKASNTEIPLNEFFNHPTIKHLAQLIESSGGQDEYLSIRPTEEKDFYPVSSAQRRMYLFQQMDVKSIVYNQYITFLLEMDIQPGRLQQTLEQMIRRHESLRTSFQLVDGNPVQRVHKLENLSFQVEYYETREPGQAGETEVEVKKIVKEFARPFDLDRPPLLRLGMIKLSASRCVMMLDMHHIMVDGTSIYIFIGEFTALYRGGEMSPLEIRYKDYCEWHNRQGQTKRKPLHQQEAYWLKQFEGEIPLLNLSTDYPRPAVQRFEGASLNFEIGLEQARDLRELAAAGEVTLYMVLLAAFNVLFYKLSGQEDIVLGVGTAGRWNEELQRIIGMFINTLALRNYPSGKKTFSQFLQEVKERTLQAFENQDYPYEDLVAQLLPNRDRSRNPIFDVMFAYDNIINAARNNTTSQRLSPEERNYGLETRVTKFDISFIAEDPGDTIDFRIEYSTALFKKETIQRFINYLKEIITGIIENKERKLEDFVISHDLLKAKLNVPQEDFENFDF